MSVASFLVCELSHYVHAVEHMQEYVMRGMLKLEDILCLVALLYHPRAPQPMLGNTTIPFHTKQLYTHTVDSVWSSDKFTCHRQVDALQHDPAPDSLVLLTVGDTPPKGRVAVACTGYTVGVVRAPTSAGRFTLPIACHTSCIWSGRKNGNHAQCDKPVVLTGIT